MPENIDNLILEHLRAMRSDITALRDDTREVKSRLTSLETAVSAMRREIADLYTDVVGQHSRYDRLLERIERIEKRLELTQP
jgi:septal ring factor EnvC (AmiA/AmiB activator)